MTCQTCSAQGALEGRVPDPTVIGVFGDAAQCTCAQGYKQAAASCSVSLPSVCGPFTCTSCATLDSTTVASRDRTRCMKCGTDATLDTTISTPTSTLCVCVASHSCLVLLSYQPANRLGSRGMRVLHFQRRPGGGEHHRRATGRKDVCCMPCQHTGVLDRHWCLQG